MTCVQSSSTPRSLGHAVRRPEVDASRAGVEDRFGVLGDLCRGSRERKAVENIVRDLCIAALSSSGSKESVGSSSATTAEIHRNLAPRDRTRTFTVFVDDGDCAEHDPHLVVSDQLSHHRHDVRIRTPADLHLLGCRPGKCREFRRPGSHEQGHAGPPALVTETAALRQRETLAGECGVVAGKQASDDLPGFANRSHRLRLIDAEALEPRAAREP